MLSLGILLAVILIVAILVTIFRAHTLVQVMRDKKPEDIGASNNVNGILFMAFLIFGIILFAWYSFSQFDRYTVYFCCFNTSPFSPTPNIYPLRQSVIK